jgi:hypothetical protein
MNGHSNCATHGIEFLPVLFPTVRETHPHAKLTMAKTYTDKLTSLSAVIYSKLGPAYHEDFWALIREVEKAAAAADKR